MCPDRLDQNSDGFAPFEVTSGWPEEKPDVDIIIVDMTPSTTDVPQGTVVLPYQPTRLSYGVVPKHLPKLEKENLKIVQVVSMVDRRKEEHRTFTLDKVKNENAKVIAQRSIYERVAGLGRTVFDPALKGMYGIREAKKEMTELFLEASK